MRKDAFSIRCKHCLLIVHRSLQSFHLKGISGSVLNGYWGVQRNDEVLLFIQRNRGGPEGADPARKSTDNIVNKQVCQMDAILISPVTKNKPLTIPVSMPGNETHSVRCCLCGHIYLFIITFSVTTPVNKNNNIKLSDELLLLLLPLLHIRSYIVYQSIIAIIIKKSSPESVDQLLIGRKRDDF